MKCEKENELSEENLKEKFIRQGPKQCIAPKVRNAAENSRNRNALWVSIIEKLRESLEF